MYPPFIFIIFERTEDPILVYDIVPQCRALMFVSAYIIYLLTVLTFLKLRGGYDPPNKLPNRLNRQAHPPGGCMLPQPSLAENY